MERKFDQNKQQYTNQNQYNFQKQNGRNYNGGQQNRYNNNQRFPNGQGHQNQRNEQQQQKNQQNLRKIYARGQLILEESQGKILLMQFRPFGLIISYPGPNYVQQSEENQYLVREIKDEQEILKRKGDFANLVFLGEINEKDLSVTILEIFSNLSDFKQKYIKFMEENCAKIFQNVYYDVEELNEQSAQDLEKKKIFRMEYKVEFNHFITLKPLELGSLQCQQEFALQNNNKTLRFDLDYDKNKIYPPKNRDRFFNTSFNRALHKDEVYVKEKIENQNKKQYAVIAIKKRALQEEILYGVIQKTSQEKFEKSKYFSPKQEDNQKYPTEVFPENKNTQKFLNQNCLEYYFISRSRQYPAMIIVEISQEIMQRQQNENLLNCFVSAQFIDWPEWSENPLVSIKECFGNCQISQNYTKLLLKQNSIIQFYQNFKEAKNLGDQINKNLEKEEKIEISNEKEKLAQEIQQIIQSDFSQGNQTLSLQNQEEISFSIDSESTFAIDDALSIKEIEPNTLWQIGIHISGVNHLVQNETELEKLISQQLQTLYLENCTIHMMPEQIIPYFSITKDQFRPVNSIYVNINKHGQIFPSTIVFKRQIIKCNYRLNYNQVQKYLNVLIQEKLNLQDKSQIDQQLKEIDLDERLKQDLKNLFQISQMIRKKRVNQGTLSEEFEQFNYFQQSVLLEKKEQINLDSIRQSNQLVESFMSLSNVLIEFLVSKELEKQDEDLVNLDDVQVESEKERQELVEAAYKKLKQLEKYIFNKVGLQLDLSSSQKFQISKNKIFHSQEISISLQKYLQYVMKINSQTFKKLIGNDESQLLTLFGHLNLGAETENIQGGQQIFEQKQFQKEDLDWSQFSENFQSLRKNLLSSISQEYSSLEISHFFDESSTKEKSNEECQLDNLFLRYFQNEGNLQLKWTSPIRKYSDLIVHRCLNYIQESKEKQTEKNEKQKQIQNYIEQFQKIYQINTKLNSSIKYIQREIKKYLLCTQILSQKPDEYNLQLAIVTKIGTAFKNNKIDKFIIDVYITSLEIESKIVIQTNELPHYISNIEYIDEKILFNFSDPTQNNKNNNQNKNNLQSNDKIIRNSFIQNYQIIAISLKCTEYYPLDYEISLFDPLNQDILTEVYAKIVQSEQLKNGKIIIQVITLNIQQFKAEIEIDEELQLKYQTGNIIRVKLWLKNAVPMTYKVTL